MEQTITMTGRGEDLVETLLKSLVENKNNQTVWQSLRQQVGGVVHHVQTVSYLALSVSRQKRASANWNSVHLKETRGRDCEDGRK